ncbi:MAG: CHASE2 domain-containing protein, partial [Spirochaetales bacterium]|nr:CHASE2 domain-containing protein [Spirochaetales bacterium]
MRKQSGWHINRRLLILGACVTFISFLLAYLVVFIAAPHFFDSLQNKIIDQFFKLRKTLAGKEKISPYIIHAVLNDTTFHTLERIYGENDFYDRILSTLSEAGVKAIACDIFFNKKSKYTDNNLFHEQTRPRADIYFPVILYPDYYSIGFDSTIFGTDNEAIIEKNLWYPKILNKG